MKGTKKVNPALVDETQINMLAIWFKIDNIKTLSWTTMNSFWLSSISIWLKYSTFQNYDTKKETKKAGIKAKGHPRSRFFVCASILLKCFP